MKDMKRDEKAQMHVLETVIAALLFFGAVQVGVQLMPDSASTTSADSLGVTGEDALRTLHNLDPGTANASDYYNSSLVYFVVTGRVSNITAYLNSTLDSTISYEIGCTIYPEGNSTTLFAMQKIVEASAVSHFSFFYSGKLYDIRLVLWREPRGVV